MYTAPHLFPAPPVRGCVAGNQEVKPDLQFSPALPKKGLLSQPFIHVSPSTHHHLVHKFSALLCCLVVWFGLFGFFCSNAGHSFSIIKLDELGLLVSSEAGLPASHCMLPTVGSENQ